MKNISLKRECNADQTGIFFINIKPQFTEIFGENIQLFRKILKFYYIHFHISIFLERWGILLLSEVIK